MIDYRAFKNEITLADAAEHEDKRDKKLTFGIIVDISEAHIYEGNNQYVTKLKVIDPSFNYMAYIKNKEIKFHKFVTIIIYSQVLQWAPKIKNVGDILRLRRFNFIVNDRGELVGYLNNYSNWLIYQGSKGASFKPTSHREIEKNVDRELTDFEKNRIEELRDWSYTFFQTYRLKFITWWTPLREPADEDKAVKMSHIANEVDLVLKTEKVIKERKAIKFIDHGNKAYDLFLNTLPLLIKNDVIKLRCVNIIFSEEGRIIQLTKNSSCLIIPDHFYDAQLFNKSARVTPVPSSIRTPDRRGIRQGKSGAPLANKREASNLFPFLVEYEYDRFIIENPDLKKGVLDEHTLLKKAYIHKMPTSMKDLVEILDNPREYEHYKFVISGKILNFTSTSVPNIVKKMDEQTRKIYEFHEKVPENSGFIHHIYHFMISMKDKSLDEKDKPLNIYVLTNEGDQHIFDLWELLPRADEYEDWQRLEKSSINLFEKKMEMLKKINTPVKMVVQLLITDKGKPFFKLYDTVFLP